MPISSKRIIQLLKKQHGDFTAGDILNSISETRNKKKAVGNKKKKKPSCRDPERIESTLRELVSTGFLSRQKNRFRISRGFMVEGKLFLDRRGGLLSNGNGLEAVIKKEDIGHAHNNDIVSAEITDVRRGTLFAEIKKVLNRDKNCYFARIINRTRDIKVFRLIDTPGDVEVATDLNGPEPAPNDLVMIQIENGTIHGMPRCRIIALYSGDDEDGDFERIKIKYSLPGLHKNYPVYNESGFKILDSSKKRTDHRKLFTITIDGEDAKDFDDAVSLKKTGHGYELYVHIADVSSHVEKGGELDLEALSRGTSFYLGNRVIPMLPEVLSNDLCSLRAGVDRYAFTVVMKIDGDGSIKDYGFHRSVINVDRRLTYTSASGIIDGGGSAVLRKTLVEMERLAAVLKKKRMGEGRIDLNMPDEKVIYNGNRVSAIKFADRLSSHMIIEEFMLSANMVVSMALDRSGTPALYRIHEEMSPESLASLKKFLRLLNVKLTVGANLGESLQKAIESVIGKEYEQVVNLAILKSMMQAYYGAEPLGHFGLGFEDYTHFTSPIRRYPDLVVHRCLKSMIDGEKPPYPVDELQKIGEMNSDMERVAQRAERDLIKIKSCRLMQERIGEVFEVLVSGIARFGFFVTLIDMPIEGMVPLKSLSDDYYIAVEDEYTVTGRKTGKRYRLGDKIKARLTKVDLETLRIDFEPA
jgi:ribonuclease R